MPRKPVAPFEIVEFARDLKEDKQLSMKKIMFELHIRGYDISANTVKDWLYYRCRSRK